MATPAPRSVVPVARRAFLAAGASAAGLALVPSILRGTGAEAGAPEGEMSPPTIRLPAQTTNGARVPVVIEMPDHPMTPDHFLARVDVVNDRDPVPLKGTFFFTAANASAYLALQARLDDGRSEVRLTAECSRQTRWTRYAAVEVAPGGGGCAGVAPPAGLSGDEVRPPEIRIVELVRDGTLGPGQVVTVQVKTRHPSRTGLVRRGVAFVQAEPPLHLREMDVLYDTERVSRFLMTAALSDSPLISFRLRLDREAPLRVVLTSTRGERFEASQPIRFG
jgi:predicted secreted protein